MNTKNKLRTFEANVRSHGLVPAVAGAVALASPLAFASGGSTFDASTILTAIAGMLAAGILIYTAYAAGRWTLRAFGLIGGK